MSVAWYLGRIAWRGRWAGLVLLGILAGVVGGVTMAAVAGARRSDTAFDRLVEASGIPRFEVRGPLPTPVLPTSYTAAIADLDEVATTTESWFFVGRERGGRDWWSVRTFGEGDRSTPPLTAGRVPTPSEADEVMVSVNTARNTGLEVGDTFVVDFYTVGELETISSNSWSRPSGPSPELHVVGIYRDSLDGARSVTGTSIIGSRAFAEAHAGKSGIQSVMVEPARSRSGQLRAALERVTAREFEGKEAWERPSVSSWLDRGRAGVRESQRVIAWGLGGFVAVTLLAGTVAHAQTVRRWLYPLEGQQPMWRALGADRSQRRWSVAVAAAPHAVVAALASVPVAWLLSPLFPFGVIGDLEPRPGLRADVPVLSIGAAVTFVVTIAVTLVVADVVVRRRRRNVPSRPVSFATSLEAAGAPLPLTTGTRFVVRPGSAQLRLPITTAVVAAILTVGGTVAAGVFTSSLAQLSSEPDRYGSVWDLSLELTAPEGGAALQSLVGDGRVDSITRFEGFNVPWLVGGRSTQTALIVVHKGQLQLRMESGRPPSGPDEIVVGPRLLDQLGLHLGDQVEVESHERTTGRMTIVGTALSPMFESPSFNAEAFTSKDLSPRLLGDRPMSDIAYAVTKVRFDDDVDAAAVSAEYDDRYPYAVMSESFPTPPQEVRNIDQMSVLPKMLAAFVAFIGVAALIHAIAVGVRSRRHDLGVLRALGFTRRQTATVVVAMTATIAIIGVALGVPLGLFGGSTGWRLVSGALFVTPIISWTWAAAALISLTVLAGAVTIALLPARSAGRRPLAETLRSE